MRATRCQVYIHSYQLEIAPSERIIGDPYHEKKSVYIIAYQEGSVIEDKIKRIQNTFSIESFSVELDRINETIDRKQELMANTKEVIKNTKTQLRQYLISVNTKADSDISVFKVYKVFMLKEKAIFTHLNMLKQQNMIF